MACAITVALPYLPRCGAIRAQALQLLLVFESIHTRPEAIVWIADQLLLCYQPVERLNHELFFIPHIVENFLLENEESSIDPHIAVIDGMDLRNHLVLEYEIPKYDGDLGQPNLFVPLEREIYENKVRYLMEAFESQRTKPWFERDTFLALMRLRGMECVAPSGYAEAFYCRKVVL